jgi:hypothetical protein
MHVLLLALLALATFPASPLCQEVVVSTSAAVTYGSVSGLRNQTSPLFLSAIRKVESEVIELPEGFFNRTGVLGFLNVSRPVQDARYLITVFADPGLETAAFSVALSLASPGAVNRLRELLVGTNVSFSGAVTVMDTTTRVPLSGIGDSRRPVSGSEIAAIAITSACGLFIVFAFSVIVAHKSHPLAKARAPCHKENSTRPGITIASAIGPLGSVHKDMPERPDAASRGFESLHGENLEKSSFSDDSYPCNTSSSTSTSSPYSSTSSASYD